MGMDISKLLSDFLALLPRDWPGAFVLFEQLFANQLMRAFGLLVLVYVTIRIIASVYSGQKNRAELGPVAIRPHVSNRYDRKTVRVPHKLIEMGLDGVVADCKVVYAYTDANGKRRRRVVHEIKNASLSVSPSSIRESRDIIYGQEVPSVPREFVCFPAEFEEPAETLPPAPADALEYANLHKILDAWREDDDAVIISMHSDDKEEIAAGKIEFINDRVEAQKKAKEKWLASKTTFPGLRKNRPNVVGSYYVQFEFSHNPFFVLTRHPDRDLKMTAWLTVLTSVFALLMDAWPTQRSIPDGSPIAPEFQNVETRPSVPRPPTVVPPS